MRLRLLAAALLCAASAARAETASPIIVTASRVAETADETLAPVTVITREDIERSQAQTLADLVRATPGVSVDVNGGRGKLTNLKLRGTSSDHTLVLVDGIKVGSATNGQVALQDIPAAQIDRIEIVRGPRSSLYGSEAIGGVVQIFTRRTQDGFTPNASLTAGSYGTRELSVGFSGRHGASWYSLQAQGVEVDGYDAWEPAEPDDDGYRSRSASLRAGHRFASGLETELHAFRSESENEFDGTAQDESESALEVFGARLGYMIGDFWHATFTAGRSRDDADNFKAGVFSTRFDTERDTASLQNDFSLGDHLLTLGFDYQEDRVDSAESYAVDSRTNRGLFTQYRTAFGAHDLQLAVREDDNEQFGRHRTGNLALGIGVTADLRLTAAYGTAFHAPTFNDLYWPSGGNPDLNPETATSTEIGLQSLAGPVRVDLRLFRTDLDGLITWACTLNCGGSWEDDIWLPVNVDRARIDGAELAIGGDIAGWTTRIAITVLEPRDEATGNVLPRRARRALRVDTDRTFGAYALGATLVAEGDHYDDLANTEELAGYATLAVRAGYRLTHDWRLEARLENVFDQDYRTAADYVQPGRSYYLTLAWRP
ncbi:MAG: TonB-dependent vitamin B12 receptor [Thiohalomonadaceae bacterium]